MSYCRSSAMPATLAWYEAKGGKDGKHVSPPAKRYAPRQSERRRVNGDGRDDILDIEGMVEAPSGTRASDGNWKLHADWNEAQATRLYPRDGRNGMQETKGHAGRAYDYGLSGWNRAPADKVDQAFDRHSWSGAHALTLGDLNGDGRKDILTGQALSAHNG